MAGFRPLEDRVLIKRVQAEEKIGNIYVPDNAREKPMEGIVIAAGPGKYRDDGTRIPVEVKQGDRVLFGKYTGAEILIEGVEHMVFRESDIIGVLT